MSGALSGYAAYRESGLQWLGQLPSHWRVARTKTLLTAIDVRSQTGGEELLTVSSDRGVIRRRDTKVTMFQAASYVGHKLCWPGDLVINSLWAWSRGLGVSSLHGIVSSAYGVYRPRAAAPVDPMYIHYLVRSTPFQWELQVRSKGVWISRLQLTDDAFLDAPMPVPDWDEQRLIARYLRWIDRRVDAYLHHKFRVIALLEEQRSALIAETVLGRVSPARERTETGVPWLGELPTQWEVLPLRRVTKARCDGPFGSGLTSAHYTDEGVRVIRLQNVGHAEFKGAAAAFISSTHYATLGNYDVEGGDVLIAGLGDDRHPAGRACVAPAGIEPAMVKADTFRFRLDERRILPEYAAYQLTATARAASGLLSTGATRQRVNLQSTSGRAVAVPPLGEQIEILRSIDARVAPLNQCIGQHKRAIELAREYRVRLVADVVTGKVDVREEATKLPPEPEDSVMDSLVDLDEVETLDDEVFEGFDEVSA